MKRKTLPMHLAGVLTVLAVFAAWLTHIITCIAAQAWLFMIVGALIAPVAVAHGVSIWLGFDWLH
jgi:hypothetical protein